MPRLVLLAAAAATWLLPLPAAAQQVCGTRAVILDSLAKDYQEIPAAFGRSSNGMLIEVFAARHGQTWTILVTRPDGNSCILAAGDLWTPMPPKQRLSALGGAV